jgi:small subunit ribosomal protein S16
MAVRVRLTRVGSKKNPIWRVVVADQRSPRDGRYIEAIGQYNPQTDPSIIRIDEERLQHWLARGAQPSGTVKQLMKAQRKSGGPTAVAGAPAKPEAAEAASEEEAAPEADAAAEADATGAGTPDADAEAPDADAAPEDSGGGESAGPESAGDAPDAGEDDSNS